MKKFSLIKELRKDLEELFEIYEIFEDEYTNEQKEEILVRIRNLKAHIKLREGR